MFERKLNLNEEQARRCVVAHLPEVEGHILHHGFWGGWHGASLTVPILRSDEGHAVVGQIHFELVPEDQTHTLLRAHADTPTARQVLEQMMGDNEVRTGKRGASQPTLADRPSWLPKKPETRGHWQKAYDYMCDLDEEYENQWHEFGDNPKPKRADYADYLAQQMRWRPCEKTISRIKRAGKERWL